MRHVHHNPTSTEASRRTASTMLMVWLGRRRHPHVTRVYGPDFMLAELERSADSGHRHFFYGGRPSVGVRLAETMRSRFPGLEIVGAMEPPFASLDELCTPGRRYLLDNPWFLFAIASQGLGLRRYELQR